MGAGGGVKRIEIAERETPVFGGAECGAVGAYERLHGTVFGELDPTHRRSFAKWCTACSALLLFHGTPSYFKKVNNLPPYFSNRL